MKGPFHAQRQGTKPCWKQNYIYSNRFKNPGVPVNKDQSNISQACALIHTHTQSPTVIASTARGARPYFLKSFWPTTCYNSGFWIAVHMFIRCRRSSFCKNSWTKWVGRKPTSSEKGPQRSESDVFHSKSEPLRIFIPYMFDFKYWITHVNSINMILKRVVSFSVTAKPLFFQYTAMLMVYNQEKFNIDDLAWTCLPFSILPVLLLGAAVDFGSRNMALGKCPGSWAMADSSWWEECVLGITVLGYSALCINAFLNRRNRLHLTKESKIMSECERTSVELIHGIVPNAKVPEYRFRGHSVNWLWCLSKTICTSIFAYFCGQCVSYQWFSFMGLKNLLKCCDLFKENPFEDEVIFSSAGASSN